LPDHDARALLTERPDTVTDPRFITEDQVDARHWSRVLTRYRAPDPVRSVLELIVTLAPFPATWTVAWWILSYSAPLAILLALGNAAFLVRLFMIQLDCGHGSFFRSKLLCNWLGRAIGVVTLMPYDVWRETHAPHHATTGNLDRRGIGDMPTLTVAEYRAKVRIARGL
jgi:omega-6 fatty acid desaturase (delta-12 desaturase)